MEESSKNTVIHLYKLYTSYEYGYKLSSLVMIKFPRVPGETQENKWFTGESQELRRELQERS